METKPRKELTSEQIEVLKARLMKARESKLNRKRIDYVQKKEEIKEEAFKKRTLTKMKTLVDKGAVKEEDLMAYLPKKEVPSPQIPKNDEIGFEEPLPTKRIPKSKPVKQPAIIPFEEPLPTKRLPSPFQKGANPQTPKKDKDRFMKLVYYKESSKKTLKRLEKLQESSSSESESEEECQFKDLEQTRKPQNDENDDNAFYKNLAMKYYG